VLFDECAERFADVRHFAHALDRPGIDCGEPRREVLRGSPVAVEDRLQVLHAERGA